MSCQTQTEMVLSLIHRVEAQFFSQQRVAHKVGPRLRGGFPQVSSLTGCTHKRKAHDVLFSELPKAASLRHRANHRHSPAESRVPLDCLLRKPFDVARPVDGRSHGPYSCTNIWASVGSCWQEQSERDRGPC